MFDELQSEKRELNLTPAVILVACGGGGTLLSIGLCGAAAGFGRLSSLGIAGLILLGLSVLAIVAGVLWLVVVFLINAFRR